MTHSELKSFLVQTLKWTVNYMNKGTNDKRASIAHFTNLSKFIVEIHT